MNLINNDFQVRMALALLHFLWLGCVAAAILGLTVRLLPTSYVELRYRVCVFALASMLPMFVVAFRISDKTQHPSTGLRTGTATLTSDFSPAAIPVGRLSNTSHALDQDQGLLGSFGGQLDLRTSEESSVARNDWISDGGSLAKYVTTAYLVGVTLFALRLIIGYGFGKRLRYSAVMATETDVQQLAMRISKRLRFRTMPAIYWCDRAVVPTVVGVLRPAVLLPLAFANGLTIEQLEHVILHEFTHLRRLDPVINFLQNLIETLFFFHPLVWWISGQVRLYRELSCDAAVVANGIDPRRYANTLIDIAVRSRIEKVSTISAVASVSSQSQLRTRLERLLGRRKASPRWYAQLADGMSLILLLVIVASLLASTLSVGLAAPQAYNSTAERSDSAIPDELRSRLPDNIEPTELAGIVLDANGKPLAGVTVDAWSWHAGDETTTDENGVFRFRPESDNGRTKVEVRWMKPGYSPHYVAQQPVGDEALVVTLNTTTFLEGSIISVDGRPAAGVTIRGAQKNIQGDGVRITEVTTETVADEYGKYRLYVFPDTYEITVASSLGTIRTEPVQVFRGQPYQKDIQLQEAVRFEAIVSDANSGEPYAGLVLWSFLQKQFQGTSDAEGRIVIDGMLPGAFEFNVGAGEPIEFRGMKFHNNGPLGRWWSPDATDQWSRLEKELGQFQRNFDDLKFDLKPGMEPVEIFVEQGVEFSGHVFDPDGKPRGGATVAPAKTGSGNSLTGDTRYSVKTEGDGSYKVVMPAGNDFSYNLMAFDGEYRQWRKWGAVARDPLLTSPGEKITDYDFTLTRGATVRGKVLAPDEAGAAPREVRAHPADLKGNRYYDPTVEVQADGTFELNGLRPGKHYIQVSPFWHAEETTNGSSVEIEVGDGETKEGIELHVAVVEQPAILPGVARNQPVDVPAAAKVIATTVGDVIFKTEDKIFSTPCFDETAMYFGACDGNFYCLDRVTGKLKWKFGGLTRVDSSPVLHEGLVFFTSFAKQSTWLHALRADSGKMVWLQRIDGVGNSDPILHNGKLYIAAMGELRSLDPKNGHEIASYENVCQIPSKIAARGNRILALTIEDYKANDSAGIGSLVCFDEGTQAVAWRLALGGCSFGKIRCDETNCYFGTRDGKAYAVELSTGKVVWKLDCSSFFIDKTRVWPGADVIDNGDSVVFTCTHKSGNDAGALICVDKATGMKRWSLVNVLGYSGSNGVTTDSVVTVTLDHKIMRIDRKTGNLLFQGLLPKPDTQWQGEYYSLVLDNGFVFIVDAQKQVWRFDLSMLK